MATINEQLNIPILRAGETMYQPDLYGGAIDDMTNNKPLVLGTAYYRSANGASVKDSWSGCNSCGGFSSATGGDRVKFEVCIGKCGVLHPFNRTKRRACEDECKTKHGITSIADYVTAGQTPAVTQQVKDKMPDTLGGNRPTGEKTKPAGTGTSPSNDPALLGMSTNTKIMLGVGALAVVGIVIFALRRK